MAYMTALLIVVVIVFLWCMVATCKGPWTPTDHYYREG